SHRSALPLHLRRQRVDLRRDRDRTRLPSHRDRSHARRMTQWSMSGLPRRRWSWVVLSVLAAVAALAASSVSSGSTRTRQAAAAAGTEAQTLPARLVVVAGAAYSDTAADETPPTFSGDGGPAVKAHLLLPDGVAVDGKGDLFIADSGNNRIRKVNLCNGLISTIAGNGSKTYSGDGGPATAAGFELPFDVAVGQDRNGCTITPGDVPTIAT